MRQFAPAVVAALACGATLADAAPRCRQALALGLDVSGSVDASEYRMQLDGLAAALDSDAARAVILSVPEAPLQISIYEWSGPSHQRLLQDWIVIDGPATLASLAQRLRTVQRTKADPSTALGAAMLFGVNLLAQRPDCWSHSLDISGDGRSNTGQRPRNVKAALASERLTINGLVIGNLDRGRDLVGYYEQEVIYGPGNFVEQAAGFDQYEKAMTRKLLRELQGLALSALPAPLTGTQDTPAVQVRLQ